MAFRFQFYFVRYAYELRTEGTTSGEVIIIFQAGIMSLIVVLLNCLLRIVVIFESNLDYAICQMEKALFIKCNAVFLLFLLLLVLHLELLSHDLYSS